MTDFPHPSRRLTWTAELVSRFWDGVWQSPMERLSFARMAGESLVLAVAHHLKPQTTCLDFGAGPGDLIEPLLDVGCAVAAFERAAEGRAKLEARFRSRPNFSGVVDSDSERTFDVVFAVEVMEHVLDEELDGTMQTISRFLEPDGLVVVTTPNQEDLDRGLCYDPVSQVLFHRWQHVRSFTCDSLAALFEAYNIQALAAHQLDFSSHWFTPLRDRPLTALPAYLRDLRQDRSVRLGTESSILFLGRRRG